MLDVFGCLTHNIKHNTGYKGRESYRTLQQPLPEVVRLHPPASKVSPRTATRTAMAAAAAASSVLFRNAWAWITAPVTLGCAVYVTANVVSGAVLELAHVAFPPDVVATAAAGVLRMAEAASVAEIAHSPSEVYAATDEGIAPPAPPLLHVHGNTDMYTSLKQKVALANDSLGLLWRRKGGECNPPPAVSDCVEMSDRPKAGEEAEEVAIAQAGRPRKKHSPCGLDLARVRSHAAHIGVFARCNLARCCLLVDATHFMAESAAVAAVAISP